MNRVFESLENSIETEMQKRSIPGLQLALFKPRELILGSSYGYADAGKQKKVNKDTLFQAGALARPLSAYTVLHFLKQNKGNLSKTLQEAVKAKIGKFSLANYSSDEPVRWGQLLGMTSGLPPSREGFVAKEDSPKSREKVLQKEGLLRIKFRPGTQVQIAPQGYAYLAEAVGKLSQRSFNNLVESELQKMGLRSSCMLLKNCPISSDRSSAKKELSSPLTSFQSSYFPAPEIDVIFPAATSLFTTAKDYAYFLRSLWIRARKDPHSSSAYLFQKHFQYDPSLGGTSHGFLFSRPLWYQGRNKYRESLVYYIESSLPGYSALAFLSSKGYGAVFLINKDDLFFLRTLQRRLYHLYGIMNFEKEYPRPVLRDKEREALQASYRPISILPEKYSRLTFLNELQIRLHEGRIELSSVFEKKVFVRLYPLEEDLFLARGLVAMDAWRIRLKRDAQGKVSGLATDLAFYRRISKFLSAQSILIFIGLLAGLPIFFALFYFLSVKRGARL